MVGCGRVGGELAVRLDREGHEVAVIDKNAGAFRKRLPEGWGGEMVVGFGFDQDDLQRAGIDRAGAVAAVTSGDNTNILTARIARETFEIPNVVARIYDPRRAVIYQRLGIPTVATVSWTVDQVLRRLLPEESVVAAWTDPTGEVNMVEHLLPDPCGRGLIGELSDEDRFRPVLVTRGGRARLVTPTMAGQEGDVVHFVVRSDAVEDLENDCWRREAGRERGHRRRRGGRPIGRQRPGPQRPRRADHRVRFGGGGPRTAGADARVRWYSGDACEVSTLQDAGFASADVVVAATGDDEDNLVVSLLAKQEFAVPRVIARVNHPKNRWLFNETWGVDVSVSTPHLMTALVEEAVSVGTLVRLLHFAEGKAGLVEVTLADDSPAGGRQIADLGLPRDACIVAVVRDRRVVVPRGDTVLQAADEVIALVTADSEDSVRRILVG